MKCALWFAAALSVAVAISLACKPSSQQRYQSASQLLGNAEDTYMQISKTSNATASAITAPPTDKAESDRKIKLLLTAYVAAYQAEAIGSLRSGYLALGDINLSAEDHAKMMDSLNKIKDQAEKLPVPDDSWNSPTIERLLSMAQDDVKRAYDLLKP